LGRTACELCDEYSWNRSGDEADEAVPECVLLVLASLDRKLTRDHKTHCVTHGSSFHSRGGSLRQSKGENEQ
jgi:hypothetical protein